MTKRISLERMTRELLAARSEYNAARNHFAGRGKLSGWEKECRKRERDRYRRVLIKGIRFLSEELELSLDEETLPPKPAPKVSSIEQDIADGHELDIPDAE